MKIARNQLTAALSLLAVALMLVSSLVPTQAAPLARPVAQAAQSTALAFADANFQATWKRTDNLVASGAVRRSFYWGPAPIYSTGETYKDAKDGSQVHLVQYFDKSRMEVNDPNGDRGNPFFVTNGLLAEELISGKMQIGDNEFQLRSPADIPLASDLTDGNAPTYRSFKAVASIGGDGATAQNLVGQKATLTINKAGAVGSDPSKSGYGNTVDVVYYDPTTQHNIPRAFWDFLNLVGPVQDASGRTVNQQLSSPWFYTTGLPISEAYWARVIIAGQPADVLIQTYERRVLTYVPSAPVGFKVQMGNVGAHYKEWRYSARGSSVNHPLQGPHVGYGFNTQLYYTDRDRVLDIVKDAGFGWVKQQVAWRDIEGQKGKYAWSQLDEIVNSANAKGIKVILSIAKSPDWATRAQDKGGMPDDPTDMGNFMYQITTHYKGLVSAYEVWNEENYRVENSGAVNAAQYFEILRYGYWGVKWADRRAVVIFGALTPTGVNDPGLAIDDVTYLRQIYAINNGEIRQYFDALGAHGAGAGNSPDQLYPDQPGDGTCVPPYMDSRDCWRNDPSFYFRRVEQLRAVMEQNGDSAKQMWLTEFGWPTATDAPGYEYGKLISEQKQGDYLVRAYQKGVNDYPWMGVMCVWNLNFQTIGLPSTDEKYPWAVLYPDYSPRPAYTALKNMAK